MQDAMRHRQSGCLAMLSLLATVLALAGCFQDIEQAPGFQYSGPPGSLDTNFGGGTGSFVFPTSGAGTASEAGNALAIDTLGRILVAGAHYNGSDNDMAIWRILTDGSLDPSFGGGTGYVTHDNAAGGSGPDRAADIVVDGQGRILVVGESASNVAPQNDMAVWRLLEDGSLDPSFNSDGVFTHNNAAGGNQNDEAMSVLIDGSGRILVVGYSYGAPGRMVVWRLATDGTLDTTFAGAGYFVSAFAGYGFHTTFDSQDRILVAGTTFSDVFVCRIGTDGALDTTFNSTGCLFHDNAAGGGGYDDASALVLLDDGTIVAVGTSTGSTSAQDFSMWRIQTDGALDTALAGVGYTTLHNIAGGDGNDKALAAARDANGRLIISGNSVQANGDYDAYIMRMDVNGNLDAVFNGIGLLVFDSPVTSPIQDRATDVQVDAMGRIVAVGISATSSSEGKMAVWRINP